MKIILLNQQEVRLADLGELAIDPIEYEALDLSTRGHRFSFAYPLAEADSAVIAEENKVAVEFLDGSFRLYRIVSREVVLQGSEQLVVAECEAVFYELLEKEFINIPYSGGSPTFILTSILSGSGWSAGAVAAGGAVLGDGPGLVSIYKAVVELAAATGTEPVFGVTVSGAGVATRYVDLVYPESFSGKRFEVSRDLKSVKITVDTSDLRTALYGYGEGEDIDVDGETVRIDFATVEWVKGVAAPLYDGGPSSPAPLDKPLGQTWLGDPDARDLYGIWNPVATAFGHRFDVYDSEAKDPYSLLWATYNKLRQVIVPLVNVEASVMTLEQLTGFEHERVRLGMSVVVKVEDLVPLAARIIRIDRHRRDPSRTLVELGQFRPTSSAVLSDIRRSLSDFGGRRGVWDRAIGLNPDGTLPTSALDGIIDAVQNQISIGGGSVVADGDGLWVYDSNDPSTSLGAIRMVAYGGEAALAVGSRALITDPWSWRAGITSDGFAVYGEEIVAGTLSTGAVKIEGDTNFYWDASNIYAIKPSDPLVQLRFGKYDGVNFGIGLTLDGGSTWKTALDFDGLRIGAEANYAVGYNPTLISIGGKNLVLGSNFESWETWGYSTLSYSLSGLMNLIKATRNSSSAGTFGFQSGPGYKTVQVGSGIEYTLTFEARGTVGLNLDYLYIVSHTLGAPQLITLPDPVIGSTTAFKKFQVTFTSSGSKTDGILRFATTGGVLNNWFEVRAVQLERGNKATDWSLAPEDMGDLPFTGLVEAAKLGSTIISGGYLVTGLIGVGNIRIGGVGEEHGKLEIYDNTGELAGSWEATGPSMSEIDVANIKIAGNPYFKNDTEDYYVNASTGNDAYDGKSASVSGTAGPFRTIQKAIDQAGKVHAAVGNVFIYIAAGDYYENVELAGVLGSNLIVKGNSISTTTIYGSVAVRSCSGVEFQTFRVYASNSNPFSIFSSTGIYLTDVAISGNSVASSIGLLLRFGSTAYMVGGYLNNCTLSGAYVRGGSFLVLEARGSGNFRGVTVIEGSILTGYTHFPTGTTNQVLATGGVVLSSGTPTADGAPPSPVPVPTTTQWTANQIGAWRAVDGWRTDYMMQGYYTGGLSYAYKGYAGFDDAAIRSALSGKTIKNIRVKMKRRAAGGNSGARNLYFYSHNYTSRPGGDPTLDTSRGLTGAALGSLSWGEEKWITLPIAFGNALRDNTAKGLAIYFNGSDPYMYIEGNPVLEISYE